MPAPQSVSDQSVDDVIADARRRAGMTDDELSAANLKRPFRSPVDWRDTCMYFAMIDRFNNPAKRPASEKNDPPVGWDMHWASRQGGTLPGITAQLDYLQKLGVNAIWISPLVRNSAASELMTYHGYAAQNLLAIDERWASDGDRATAEKELTELVSEAHDRGIYVILDIVLNHVGRVFWYDRFGKWVTCFQDRELLKRSEDGGDLPDVLWTEGYGRARGDWRNTLSNGQATGPDEAAYPVELRDASLFRRRGGKTSDRLSEYPWLKFVPGDFGDMRQLVVEYQAADEDALRCYGRYPTLALLLRCYQYLVARYDFDGLRIDTVKYVHPKQIQRFGNAMTEFGRTIGKQNFFTFGEVADNNTAIADFVGRNGPGPSNSAGGLGIDAALDFPLANAIRDVCTGAFEHRAPVYRLRDVFDERQKKQDELICTHGDASAYFITFADNHDRHQRIRHPDSPDAEVRLCIALLYTLPGIPCLYYGTEQNLVGTHWDDGTPRLDSFECVREALWGKFPGAGGAWPTDGGMFKMIKTLAGLRAAHMPLRYGRHYFRQISENGQGFGHSLERGGVFAVSRIHADSEVLIVARPHPFCGWTGWIEVDPDISQDGSGWKVAFSTLARSGTGTTMTWSQNPLRRAVNVTLESNELAVLVRA